VFLIVVLGNTIAVLSSSTVYDLLSFILFTDRVLQIHVQDKNWSIKKRVREDEKLKRLKPYKILPQKKKLKFLEML
jgi:hypothetical protein